MTEKNPEGQGHLTKNCTYEKSPIVQCYGPTFWDFVSAPKW